MTHSRIIKRLLDVFISIAALITLMPFLLLIALVIKLTSKGPVLHWSKRVGRDNKIFNMPKFRSMSVAAPNIATHLLSSPEKYITPVGRWLRKSSIDELPQFLSVLKGDMSLVGPRPALFNQYDLIEARTATLIHRLQPGITGWAQINGRDDIPTTKKVVLDKWYLDNFSLQLDVKIMFATLKKVFLREGVSH